MSRLYFNWTAHKKLWNWLALHPRASKRDWPGWADINPIPRSHCFACSFAWKLAGEWCDQTTDQDHELCLQCCPLDWGKDKSCECWVTPKSPGLFRKWLVASNIITRAYYARKIAVLPLKSWVDTRWLI